MRKNKHYDLLRKDFYLRIVEKAKEKNLFLPVGRIEVQINYIFERYQKQYIFEVYRLTLRQMRNMYK